MPTCCRSSPIVLFALLSLLPRLDAQLKQRTTLTLQGARQVADAAQAEAERQGATVVIAVVDDGGHVILLRRLDDTQVASVDVAIGKGRTAAIFRRASGVFEQQIKDGRLASLVLPGATPLQGGVPIVVDGQCIGAIGVSGNTPAQDEQVAVAGAAVAAALVRPAGAMAKPRAVNVRVPARVHRIDPALDSIVPPGTEIERLAEGFAFTEGPVFVGEALLFSDPDRNCIHRLDASGVSVFRAQSGYSGADIALYRQPGSNGLALDAKGRLTLCEHGNRRVSRIEGDGSVTVIVDRYRGRRLNSPNDLVYGPDGSLYFTDPPFGLPEFDADPRKELAFSGVFRVTPAGDVELLERDLRGPNGIALSPDGSTLYVGNWDPLRKVVMRYPVRADGSVGAGSLLCDLTVAAGDAAIDGIKVDEQGHVFVAGPGGVWILAADGRPLGRIDAFPEEAHNMAWGDADGRGLYVTAQTGVYRLRLPVRGSGAFTAWQ